MKTISQNKNENPGEIIEQATGCDLQKRIVLTFIFLTHLIMASFAQESTRLSAMDSCQRLPPQQNAFALRSGAATPMLRVAYVIPSNRSAQPDAVANLQYAIKTGQRFFKEQMEQNGFGEKTFVFETEDDGVTPLIHMVPVAETDEYLRGDIWGRTIQSASNAGISLWAQGEVWVVIPEAHVMQLDGSVIGGVALGASFGTNSSPGVSMIGSNALPLLHPKMLTDDTPYHGKTLTALGPFAMKQDVTFAWFEGSTFSSLASSWLGALWHETGHAFGLAHDFRNDRNFHGNLMGNGLRGTRGSLFPEKYSQDYTRLEYTSSLILNLSHYFNQDKAIMPSPVISYKDQERVTPKNGLVRIAFQCSDYDSLSLAHLRYNGNTVDELELHGTEVDTAFWIPYYTKGDISQYTIAVHDKQGNNTYRDLQFYVPAEYNQAPLPYVQITPPVPVANQPITLDARSSSDADDDLSPIVATWDVNQDGQYDTEPTTNKVISYTFTTPGSYLVRVKLTDPDGAQAVSTPVSVKVPGQKEIAVESFSLIDANNDEVIRELEEGLILREDQWEDKTFSVRANTSTGSIDRLVFDLQGPIEHQQIERKAPFALFGDDANGDFAGKQLLPGEYTLTAVPFAGSKEGVGLSVSFKVIRKAAGNVTIAWDKAFGGTVMDQLKSVASTTDGGFLLAGTSNSNISGEKSENGRGAADFWIVKIDSQHNKMWDRTFGGNRYDQLTCMIATNDGGYLLGGYSSSDISGDKSSSSHGSSDYWILRIDNEGNKVWDKTFGGAGDDILYSIILAPNGDYLLAGDSDSGISYDKSEFSQGSFDYWIVCIDKNGNKIWDKTFGGNSIDGIQSVTLSKDGYLLEGSSMSEISGDKTSSRKGETDFWVVKVDHDGDKIWDRTYGGNSQEGLTAAVASSDGGYVLSGYSWSDSNEDKSEDSKGAGDYWIVKIDSVGNRIWDNTIGGTSSESVGAMAVLPNHGYLLSGTSGSGISEDKTEDTVGGDDYWVVRIDEQGNKVWDKTIGGSTIDINAAALVTPAGDYLIAGYSQSGATGDKGDVSRGNFDYWIVELQEPKSPATINFSLMNAQADSEIRILNDGDTIRLTDVGFKPLDIRANVVGANTTSVVFDLTGPVGHHQLERQVPYALFGDESGNFNGHKLLAGNYSLKATSFDQQHKIATVMISFTVTDGFGIHGFTLIDATLDKVVRRLNDGDVIDLSLFDRHKLAIRADAEPLNMEKVDLELQGPVCYRGTERVHPYALFGDIPNKYGTDYVGSKLQPGTYALTATPYLYGHRGGAARIRFEVITGNASACRRFDVYPIPATDVINIAHEGIPEAAFVILLDQNGNVLVNRRLSQQPVDQVDVRGLRGTHYIKIRSSEFNEIIRVMIK